MTRPPKDTAIQRLQKALDAVEGLKQQQQHSSSPEFQKWHRNTEIAIANTFGENSRHVKDFTNISYSLSIASTSTTDSDWQRAYIRGIERATSVLQSMIEEYWEDDSLTRVSTSDKKTSPEHLRDVFIIHGRDEGTIKKLLLDLSLNSS